MELDIQGFLYNLKERKHISGNTETSYARDLKRLQLFLESQGIVEELQIGSDELNGYIQVLQQEGKKPTTISRNIASMKAYFEYRMLCGMFQVNIAEQLKAPKIEKKQPTVLSHETTELLLSIPNGDGPKELRDKAMLELLYITGIRVSELVALQLGDVDLKHSYIVCVNRKGEHHIPFDNDTKRALEKYLEKGRGQLLKDEESNILFMNCSGKPMSRQGFWKVLKTYGNKAGFETDITPHTFGHARERMAL